MKITKQPYPIAKSLFLLLFLVFACTSCGNSGNRTGENMNSAPGKVTVEVFRTDSIKGWGYEIVNGNKVFIHQEYIPALEGKIPFASKEDALKIGNRVREKILANQSPAMTREEIYTLLNMKE
jgi:hypothetical protein